MIAAEARSKKKARPILKPVSEKRRPFFWPLEMIPIVFHYITCQVCGKGFINPQELFLRANPPEKPGSIYDPPGAEALGSGVFSRWAGPRVFPLAPRARQG